MTFLRDVGRSTLQELNNDVVIFRTEMGCVANNVDGTRYDVCNAHCAGRSQIERGQKWLGRKRLDITSEDVAAHLVAKRRQPIVLGQFRRIQIYPIATAISASFIAVRWMIAIIG